MGRSHPLPLLTGAGDFRASAKGLELAGLSTPVSGRNAGQALHPSQRTLHPCLIEGTEEKGQSEQGDSRGELLPSLAGWKEAQPSD